MQNLQRKKIKHDTPRLSHPHYLLETYIERTDGIGRFSNLH